MNRKKFMQTALGALASPFAMKGARAQGLSGNEAGALADAIQDEYKARATYQKVVDTFGSVRPFSNIIKAETQHIAALAQLFQRYGLPIPPDTWASRVPAFASIEEACAAAVQAEIDNGKLYDSLFARAKSPDIIRVFEALQRASLENHLPAFQSCAGTNAGNGAGRQNGGGQGQGRGAGNPQGQMRGQGQSSGQGRGNGNPGGQMRGQMQGRGQGRGSGNPQGQMRGQMRGQSQGQGNGNARGQGQGGSNGRGSGRNGGGPRSGR